MIVSSGSDFGTRVCRAVGVDPTVVRGIEIRANVDDVATAAVRLRDFLVVFCEWGRGRIWFRQTPAEESEDL